MMKYCLEKKKKDNFFDDEGKLVWINEDLVINFGKYKGHSLKVLVLDERSYLEWVVCQDFTDDVKKAIRDSLSGTFPKRET